MSERRIIGWLLVPFVMVFVDWKRAHVLLKIYGVCAAFFFLMTVVAVGTMDQTKTKEPEQKVEVKKEPAKPKVLTDEQIYPPGILKAIKDLETSKEPKNIRYKLFDEEVIKVIQFQPSDQDLEFYKKFVLSDYKKMSFDYVNSLSDNELLKIIYRNRPVDMYYVHREIYDSPLGGVAFNVIQIAREKYEGTLTQENYKLFKQSMDKHYKNM